MTGEPAHNDPPELLTGPEARVLGRAITERWPIPMQKRLRIIECLLHTMETSEDPRAVAACGNVFAKLDALNVEAEAPKAQAETVVRVVYEPPKPPVP